MKFQQISAFKAVIELGTVTAAANYLHIAQPAVSRLIASLEEAVGFPLFERIKGRLQPTSQGRAFYLEVDRAFVGMERLRQSASTRLPLCCWRRCRYCPTCSCRKRCGYACSRAFRGR
ncbi:LysR family transcriptional regulator [Vogesella oryzae]|uniref:LysR family transcriptional regulator n=1 Tax=Vogesella oryzae TaxID=1735285 RepID=UPI0015833A79|nr:LysR family transcriptional regulator [Vogesella oryzae]